LTFWLASSPTYHWLLTQITSVPSFNAGVTA
jgi:hypothetical protein